jgi:EAL domain-containing protein (putative c-di-GMP-specific phosphodiesterase class I)
MRKEVPNFPALRESRYVMTPDNPNSTRSSSAQQQRTEGAESFLSNLVSAISNHELCLHYQPRYDVETGQAITLEALTRWQKPSVGLLYPETFISEAEQHGLIFQLDLWVFEQCCKDIGWLHDNIDDSLSIAVNISVLSCESVYFSHKLIELCEKYEVPLSHFLLDITVNTHSHDVRKVKAFCETLGNYGARFCLDDFGTGQSPLSNLYHLPIDCLIIDRVFISGIGHSERGETIIKHQIKLAHALGMKIVGEGVEHLYQCKFLVDHECDIIQGHLMNKPVEKEKLSTELSALPV